MLKTIVSTYMDMSAAEQAQALGHGKAARGVREALRRARITAHLFAGVRGDKYFGPKAADMKVGSQWTVPDLSRETPDEQSLAGGDFD